MLHVTSHPSEAIYVFFALIAVFRIQHGLSSTCPDQVGGYIQTHPVLEVPADPSDMAGCI